MLVSAGWAPCDVETAAVRHPPPLPSAFEIRAPTVPHAAFADIEFVYFDLDHTLWDHDTAESRAVVDLARRRGWPAEPFRAAYRRHNEWCWREMSAGRLRTEDARRLRFELTFQELSIEVGGVAYEEIGVEYLELYLRESAPVVGAVDTIRALGARHRLGILSNGFAETQFAKLKHLGFDGVFEQIVLSEDVGTMKPNAAIFEEAARRAGVAAGRVALVGDNPDADILGAARLGWKTIWYLPPHLRDVLALPEGLPPDAPTVTISDLRELSGLFL